jgi:hypothetical protein
MEKYIILILLVIVISIVFIIGANYKIGGTVDAILPQYQTIDLDRIGTGDYVDPPSYYVNPSDIVPAAPQLVDDWTTKYIDETEIFKDDRHRELRRKFKADVIWTLNITDKLKATLKDIVKYRKIKINPQMTMHNLATYLSLINEHLYLLPQYPYTVRIFKKPFRRHELEILMLNNKDYEEERYDSKDIEKFNVSPSGDVVIRFLNIGIWTILLSYIDYRYYLLQIQKGIAELFKDEYYRPYFGDFNITFNNITITRYKLEETTNAIFN